MPTTCRVRLLLQNYDVRKSKVQSVAWAWHAERDLPVCLCDSTCFWNLDTFMLWMMMLCIICDSFSLFYFIFIGSNGFNPKNNLAHTVDIINTNIIDINDQTFTKNIILHPHFILALLNGGHLDKCVPWLEHCWDWLSLFVSLFSSHPFSRVLRDEQAFR